MVRAMTDEEARRAQIAENLQRADMHPIEEAEGFQALIDRHRESADSIAEQVGNTAATSTAASSSWRRTPEIRKTCLAGEIGQRCAAHRTPAHTEAAGNGGATGATPKERLSHIRTKV